MKKLTKQSLVLAAIALGISSVALADDDEAIGCSARTLKGLYIFAATGYSIPVSGPAQPKAVVEMIRFAGDGNLFVPAATRSINGVIARSQPGGGTYTVAANCTGTLAFGPPGPGFDIFVEPSGGTLYMIQTDSGNVLQGTVERVSR